MENSIKIKQVLPNKVEEIISLEEAKSYLKIDFVEQDKFIRDIIRASREYAEKFLSSHLVKKKFKQKNFGQNLQVLRLMHYPVLLIENISIIDLDNNKINLSSDEYYYDYLKTISISKLASLYNQVEINYIVGYESVNLVPAPIKTGMLIHIASIYDRGDLGDAIPQSSLNLYQPYRKRHL
ncbi:MAG: head-tail connector protein [Alphaproteobacteria bacterium]|nr:head-tail connector protein [Alphaproteobacteria bacterium]